MEVIEVVAIWIGICLSLLTAVKLKIKCGTSSCRVGNTSPDVSREAHHFESSSVRTPERVVQKSGCASIAEEPEREERTPTDETEVNDG